MNKKQWYVGCIKDSMTIEIRYTNTKQEATKLYKTLENSYVDFVWKQDVLNVSFSKLHGSTCLKVA